MPAHSSVPMNSSVQQQRTQPVIAPPSRDSASPRSVTSQVPSKTTASLLTMGPGSPNHTITQTSSQPSNSSSSPYSPPAPSGLGSVSGFAIAGASSPGALPSAKAAGVPHARSASFAWSSLPEQGTDTRSGRFSYSREMNSVSTVLAPTNSGTSTGTVVQPNESIRVVPAASTLTASTSGGGTGTFASMPLDGSMSLSFSPYRTQGTGSLADASGPSSATATAGRSAIPPLPTFQPNTGRVSYPVGAQGAASTILDASSAAQSPQRMPNPPFVIFATGVQNYVPLEQTASQRSSQSPLAPQQPQTQLSAQPYHIVSSDGTTLREIDINSLLKLHPELFQPQPQPQPAPATVGAPQPATPAEQATHQPQSTSRAQSAAPQRPSSPALSVSVEASPLTRPQQSPASPLAVRVPLPVTEAVAPPAHASAPTPLTRGPAEGAGRVGQPLTRVGGVSITEASTSGGGRDTPLDPNYEIEPYNSQTLATRQVSSLDRVVCRLHNKERSAQNMIYFENKRTNEGFWECKPSSRCKTPRADGTMSHSVSHSQSHSQSHSGTVQSFGSVTGPVHVSPTGGALPFASGSVSSQTATSMNASQGHYISTCPPPQQLPGGGGLGTSWSTAVPVTGAMPFPLQAANSFSATNATLSQSQSMGHSQGPAVFAVRGSATSSQSGLAPPGHAFATPGAFHATASPGGGFYSVFHAAPSPAPPQQKFTQPFPSPQPTSTGQFTALSGFSAVGSSLLPLNAPEGMQTPMYGFLTSPMSLSANASTQAFNSPPQPGSPSLANVSLPPALQPQFQHQPAQYRDPRSL